MWSQRLLLAVIFFSFQAQAHFRYLVMHSQTKLAPSCSDLPVGGWSAMWTGYSMLGNYADRNYSSSQDLASTGSCAEDFVPTGAASIECTKGYCDYQTAGDLTTWLGTKDSNNDFNVDMNQTSGKNTAMDRISRCVVCMGKKPIVVKHSYSGTTPDCPGGWSELWQGYSLGTLGYDAGRVTSMDLGDTGSCIKTFDPAPVVYCWGDRCYYNNGPIAIWLLNHDTVADDSSRSPGNSTNNLNRIGRCRVCVKN